MSGLRIDETKAVVYGVKILGPVSRNRLVFPAATRRRAHRLMEGAKVNWDHPRKGTRETPLAARFGWLTNVREDPASDCTRADLNYLKGHPQARHFLSIVRQNPGLCGFSILGGARRGGTDAEGRTVVAEITDVESFDVVADPANTLGLFESARAAGAGRGRLTLAERFDGIGATTPRPPRRGSASAAFEALYRHDRGLRESGAAPAGATAAERTAAIVRVFTAANRLGARDVVIGRAAQAAVVEARTRDALTRPVRRPAAPHVELRESAAAESDEELCARARVVAAFRGY